MWFYDCLYYYYCTLSEMTRIKMINQSINLSTKPVAKIPRGSSHGTEPMARGMVHIHHKSNTCTGIRHVRESLTETTSSKFPYIINLNGTDWHKERRRYGVQSQWNSLFSEKGGKTTGMRDFYLIFCPQYIWLIIRVFDQNKPQRLKYCI